MMIPKRTLALGMGTLLCLATGSALATKGEVRCEIVVGDANAAQEVFQIPAKDSVYERLVFDARGYSAFVEIESHGSDLTVEMSFDFGGDEPGVSGAAGFTRLRAERGASASDYVDIKHGRLTCHLS